MMTMTRVPRYSIKKTASELRPKDRFYMAGTKYCVTHEPIKDLFERDIVTFVKVDAESYQPCDLHVHPEMTFMVLTGESGIGEKAYNASIEKEKP
jgi:hypothetical protein